MMAGCGRMILGSDSHTRYGALGTMGVGEGGPEIVKQLLGDTYDSPSGGGAGLSHRRAPRGVGPHDVAIALCGAVYQKRLRQEQGAGIRGPRREKSLPMDYRIGIDVMTTETACLSSIWETDGAVEEYLAVHGRRGLQGAGAGGRVLRRHDGDGPLGRGAHDRPALPPLRGYTIRELQAERRRHSPGGAKSGGTASSAAR
jgi:aconitase A